MFPEIPPWEGMHVLIVHIPIGVLAVAPVLVLIAAFRVKCYRALLFSALVLMAIGSIGAFMATDSGGDAARAISPEVYDKNPTLGEAIHEHAGLAKDTRNAFTGLTLLLAVLLVIPMIMKGRWTPRMETIALVIFLVACAGAELLLINAGHAGGRLVHEFGVLAKFH
ncbi:MAG: hypothetical protein WC712_02950 [Candidatus Brocadiia bacterium]